MEGKKECFVVTPIGEDNSKIRRHIDGVIDAAITPALSDQFELIIPHRIYDSSAITKQIYQKLNESDLVVANLTELNPNVMYELAIRFCIGKPVIIIAEEGTKLPFDVKDCRVFFYVNDAQGTIDLRKSIKNALSLIKFDNRPSSPVFDILGEIALFKQLKNEENNVTDSKASNKDETSNRVMSLILKKMDNLEVQMRQMNANDNARTIQVCNEKEFNIEAKLNKIEEDIAQHNMTDSESFASYKQELYYLRKYMTDNIEYISVDHLVDYTKRINRITAIMNDEEK